MALKTSFLLKKGNYKVKDAYLNIYSITLIRGQSAEIFVDCYKDKASSLTGDYIERKVYSIDKSHEDFELFMGEWELEQKSASPYINAYKFLKTKGEFVGHENVFEGEEGWPDEERTKPQPKGV